MRQSSAIQMIRLSEIIAGGSEHALERLLRNPGILKDILEAAEMRDGDNRFYGEARWQIRKALSLAKYPAPEVFQVSVEVNPSIGLEELVDLGKYQNVSVGIQQVIKTKVLARAENPGKVKVSVLYFDRDIISFYSDHEMIDREVDQTTIEVEIETLNRSQFGRRFRPLNVDELLAVGSQKPDLQKKYPLIAYGLFSNGANIALDDSGPRPDYRRLVEYDLTRNTFYEFYRILAVEM